LYVFLLSFFFASSSEEEKHEKGKLDADKFLLYFSEKTKEKDK
jgi:hypothetical protein